MFCRYLVDCICLVVSGSSNIFTMGSVSDCSCFSWATTSVLFSLRADTGREKKAMSHNNTVNQHDRDPGTTKVHCWIDSDCSKRCAARLRSSNINMVLGYICGIYWGCVNGDEVCIHQAWALTVGDFLLGIKASVHIHGEVHHVCLTEEIQFSMKKFLFIVDLKQHKT